MALIKRLCLSHLFIILISNTAQEDFRLEDKRNGKKIRASLLMNNDILF